MFFPPHHLSFSYSLSRHRNQQQHIDRTKIGLKLQQYIVSRRSSVMYLIHAAFITFKLCLSTGKKNMDLKSNQAALRKTDTSCGVCFSSLGLGFLFFFFFCFYFCAFYMFHIINIKMAAVILCDLDYLLMIIPPTLAQSVSHI